MKIVRHRARAKSQAEDRDGAPLPVSSTGYSDLSQEEAEREAEKSAQEVARRITERIMHGERGRQRRQGYQYGERPLKEELIRELHDAAGNRIAALTRNSYGALVLNTARMAFVDIDLPVPGALYPLQRFVTGLFGSPTPHPAEERSRRMFEWIERARDYGLRIYETHSGYRLLVTDPPMAPSGEEARNLLDGLEADPLYRRLCQQQECFRARLTPKHWRCGLNRRPPHRFPFLNEREEAERRRWEREYDRIAEGYATCRLLQRVGDGAMPDEAARIVGASRRVDEVRERSAAGVTAPAGLDSPA